MEKPKQYRPYHKSVKAKHVFNERTESDKLYDSHWTEYRTLFLSINNTCYMCENFATVVDHLEPHKGDINLFWKEDNYIPLCKSDHDRVTNLFDRRHVIGTRPAKKIEYLQGARMMRDISKRVKVVPFPKPILEWITQLKAQIKLR